MDSIFLNNEIDWSSAYESNERWSNTYTEAGVSVIYGSALQ